MRRAYLDWNATAPLRPEAREAMLAAMDAVGNPSSVHTEGRAAKAIVEKARGQVAALVGCEPDEVVFTSGATEAAAMVFAQSWKWAITGKMEHDATWENWSALASRTKVDIPWWPLAVDKEGFYEVDNFDAVWDVKGADSVLAGGRVLIAFHAANSETGVRQPVHEAAALSHRAGIFIFCDAVPAVARPYMPSFAELGYAFLSVAAHKFGGPKGVGALIVRNGIELNPLLRGGGQEMRRRSGTENVVGIAGFGAAAEAAQEDIAAGVWDGIEKLRNKLEARLIDAAPELVIFGREVERLPNTSCFAIPGWKGETQVMQLDLAGFAVSAGSACASGKTEPSPVLTAMGFDEETASSAIRVSIGPTTTETEVMGFADTWIEHYRRRRERAA